MSTGRQLGFFWGSVAASLVALSPWAERLGAGLWPCPLKTLAGFACPSCGATRAALALARFDFAAALAVNPLAALAWSVLVGGGLVAGLAAIAGRGVPEPPRSLPLALRLAVLGVVAVNWLYVLRAGS